MSENIYYTYALLRLDTGAPCYIGKGKGKRTEQHTWLGKNHYNRYLGNIITKHGVAVVIIRDELTEEEAFETEIALIAAIGRKAHGGPLANLTDGGEGASGYTRNEESRQRQSEASRKAINRPGAKERLSETLKVVMNAPETKERHRAACKAAQNDPETKRRMREVLDQPEAVARRRASLVAAFQRPESKQKLQEASARNNAKPEVREKISQTLKGRVFTDEWRRKISEGKRRNWALKKAQAAE